MDTVKKDVFRAFVNFAPVADRAARAKMAREIYDSLFRGTPCFSLDDRQCENFAGALKGITGEAALRDFCRGSRKFSEIVTQDILGFVKSAKCAVLESENPFAAEYELLEESLGTGAGGAGRDDGVFRGVVSYLAELYPEDFDADFWREMGERGRASRRGRGNAAGRKKDTGIVRRYIHNKWRRLLDAKNAERERSIIAEMAFDFLRQLKKQIENIETVSRTLRPEGEELGRLWNAVRGNWQRSSYDVLNEYSALFLRDLALRELVRTLGRARKNSFCEYEYAVSSGYEELHIKNAGGKTELSGVCESADISAVLPSETALLTERDTELLFYRKYREGRLQCYEYSEDVVLKRPCPDAESARKRKRDTEGAFILCIDTSGSMRGINEKFAKSIVFAVLKFALGARRSCYLISFSTEIETLELSDIPASLPALIEFLSMSFNGGSNAFSALNETLRMLETKTYKKADVVFISDFVLPDLDAGTLAGIREAQKRDVLFHGILLGDLKDDGINQSLPDCFNSIAVYNP